MKTKSLVMTAAVALAGALSCFAQPVYSVNVVGYVNQVLPAGYSMVGNQLNASPNNTITNLFKDPPAGTTIFKFDRTTGGFLSEVYLGGALWVGDDDQMTMNPGEGVFLLAPSTFTNTFVGEIKSGNTNAVTAGYSILSSPLPISGKVDADLGIAAAAGDTVFRFDASTGGYLSDVTFGGGAWVGDSGGEAPTVSVGQAFFYYNASPSSFTWTKNYTP